MAAYDGEVFNKMIMTGEGTALRGTLNAEGEELKLNPGSTPVIIHYNKRAWRLNPLPNVYVEWNTTNPTDTPPVAGVYDPPNGVIIYEF